MLSRNKGETIYRSKNEKKLWGIVSVGIILLLFWALRPPYMRNELVGYGLFVLMYLYLYISITYGSYVVLFADRLKSVRMFFPRSIPTGDIERIERRAMYPALREMGYYTVIHYKSRRGFNRHFTISENLYTTKDVVGIVGDIQVRNPHVIVDEAYTNLKIQTMTNQGV